MGQIRILCWNVNGIRAIWKKGFPEWFSRESPDILCLQETKAHPDQLEEDVHAFEDYKSYFVAAERKGYSGVGIYSQLVPKRFATGMDLPHFDSEGRVIEMEFENFILFNVYFPNGGRGTERVKYKLDFYEALFQRTEMLRKTQPNIIICGDYNTAHQEIDLARPKENSKVSGFLPEERAWIDKIVELQYVDTFRAFHPEPGWYTFWDNVTRARERNVGWRIDYFFVTKEMMPMIVDSKIFTDVMGSDHCPVELIVQVS